MIRPQDVADILIMSFLIYQMYRWFKNSKALQVLIGLGFLGVLYVVTKNFGLFMTSWILQELETVFFVLIVVIFQAEIRQALYRFSLLRNLFGRQAAPQTLDLSELSRAVFSLAAVRTGALIVLQRREQLDEYLLHGVPLDSLISSQLLESVFNVASPLHDGALIIRDGRAQVASCHLPLSTNTDLPQSWGTRHRAGIGLTERADAAVIIVSEERGDVSLALNGSLDRMSTPEQLHERLQELLEPLKPTPTQISVKEWLCGNLWPKLTTVLLVTMVWLIVTAKQGGILTVTAPVRFHGLPDSVALIRNTPEEVEVQLKVFSLLAPSPKQLDLVADLDLSKVKQGNNTVAIRPEDFKVPLGMLVTSVTPSTARVAVERKVRRTLKVQVKTSGVLAGRGRLRGIVTDPATVLVEGPEQAVLQLDGIRTETVDLTEISRNSVLEKRLVPPDPPVRLLREEPVRVRVLVTGR
jgi:uncharacterized protein (TIGR00159 family)